MKNQCKGCVHNSNCEHIDNDEERGCTEFDSAFCFWMYKKEQKEERCRETVEAMKDERRL